MTSREQMQAAGDTAKDNDHDAGGLTALVSKLLRESEALLLQEFALIRAETADNLGLLMTGVMLTFAGLLVAFAGLLAVAGAALLLAEYVMPLWLACALIALLLGGGGGALALYGRSLMKRASLIPRRALQSIHETQDWMNEELS